MRKRFTAKLGDYTATIHMRPYEPHIDAGFWHGGSESPPKEVVHRCEVRYRGKVVPLGRGVYCDLAEVNRIYFYKNRRGEVVLTIEGGDAADGYNAYLVFSKGELVRRRVENGEFPKNFYEETRYIRIPYID